MDKVIMVSVTYNSSQFLERLLQAVHSQTYPVDRVVVLDNASTGIHKERLMELTDRYKNLEVVESDKNLGGAGGFEYIMRHVKKKGLAYDWLWMTDDDAFPEVDCLEKLMKRRQLKNAGCLAPVIYGTELKKYQLYHFRKEYDLIHFRRVAGDYGQLCDITPIDSCAFVGILIKSEVIDTVGFPDGDLFLEGDDRDYTYRISRK